MIEQIPIIQQLIEVNMLIVISPEDLIAESSQCSPLLTYLLVFDELISLAT